MARQKVSILLGVALLALGATGCPDGSDQRNCPEGTVREGNKCVPPPLDAARPDSAVDAGPDGASPDVAPDISTGPDAPTGPIVVFDDDYQLGAAFNPFQGAVPAPLSIDTAEKQSGSASLKIAVPDPSAGYAGGFFLIPAGADLSKYDALTFWAKASEAKTLDTVGIGIGEGTTTYISEVKNLALTTSWQKFVIPIPAAAKLTSERGLFHFGEGDTSAYTIWLDEIKYETLGSSVISKVEPTIPTLVENLNAGDSKDIAGTQATYTIDGVTQVSTVAPASFDFTSTDAAVAEVNSLGKLSAKSAGTATITATLSGTAATGAITVNVTGTANLPTQAAPTPTAAAGDVISLFSDAYSDVPVSTWSAPWDNAELIDDVVAGNAVKKYTKVQFIGIEFTSQPVDASAMTHFHVDVWTPDATVFKIKLVDFGGDKAFGGGDDSEHELTFNASSNPALTTGGWVGFDIPFTQFTGLTARGALAQLIFVGAEENAPLTTLYIDNIYFRK